MSPFFGSLATFRRREFCEARLQRSRERLLLDRLTLSEWSLILGFYFKVLKSWDSREYKNEQSIEQEPRSVLQSSNRMEELKIQRVASTRPEAVDFFEELETSSKGSSVSAVDDTGALFLDQKFWWTWEEQTLKLPASCQWLLWFQSLKATYRNSNSNGNLQ